MLEKIVNILQVIGHIPFTFIFVNIVMGARGSAVGWRHCATSRKVEGSIPDSVIGFFH
jgi:hypothetical protein